MDPITTKVAGVAVDSAKGKFAEWFGKLVEKVNLKYQTILIDNREHFMDYLTRTYEKFSYIRPVGFRDTLKFLDIYIPLTLVCEQRELVVDEFPDFSILKNKTKKKHILIVDNAGMGKSTVSKRMFLSVYENGNFGIPVFIELRHLSRENDIVKETLHQIGNLSSSFDEKLFKILVENGGFVFFLDGYDEISLEEKQDVTKSLQSFIDKAGNNTFILTSRNDDTLNGFQTFDQFSIKQLKKEEAYTLLRNLDCNGNRSELLIKTIEGEFSTVNEFLTNPLLVTLLYTALDFKLSVPPKKHLFYEQVYDAFFQAHDLTKGEGYEHKKKCGLAKDDFAWILSCIGFISVLNGKIDFTEVEIKKAIGIAKEKYEGLRNSKLCFKEDEFLDDILYAVPLFSHEGLRYKWAHKSMSEYFAVKYFTNNTDEQGLVNTLQKSFGLNSNILDFYYDIKPFAFRQFLLLPFLNNIKNRFYPENSDDFKNVFCSYMFVFGYVAVIIYRKLPILSRTKQGFSIDFIEPEFDPSKPDQLELDFYVNLYQFLANKNILVIRKSLTINTKDHHKYHTALSDLVKKHREIRIDLKNIGEFDATIVHAIFFEKINKFEFFDANSSHSFSIPFLTKDICENEIKSINSEISRNNDKGSYSIF